MFPFGFLFRFQFRRIIIFSFFFSLYETKSTFSFERNYSIRIEKFQDYAQCFRILVLDSQLDKFVRVQVEWRQTSRLLINYRGRVVGWQNRLKFLARCFYQLPAIDRSACNYWAMRFNDLFLKIKITLVKSKNWNYKEINEPIVFLRHYK